MNPLQRLAGIAAKALDLLDQDTDDSCCIACSRRWPARNWVTAPRTPLCVLWCASWTARKLQVAPFARSAVPGSLVMNIGMGARTGQHGAPGLGADAVATHADSGAPLSAAWTSCAAWVWTTRMFWTSCAGTNPHVPLRACLRTCWRGASCIWPTALWQGGATAHARGAIVAQGCEIHGRAPPRPTSVWARPRPRPPASPAGHLCVAGQWRNRRVGTACRARQYALGHQRAGQARCGL